MKRITSLLLAGAFLLPTLATLSGCGGSGDEIVLKVYNWEEYIDEGGEGSFLYDEFMGENGQQEKGELLGADFLDWYKETTGTPLTITEEGPSVIDDFEKWYEKTYGEKVTVEYSTFGTNEDMYNEIVLGNEYDLLCPSDYMIMKLAAEGRLEKYDEAFFDETDENNYYVRNVSPYIAGKFATNAGLATLDNLWKDYAAGYMWGTTGFVYNPDAVSEEQLESLDWRVFIEESAPFTNKITAKDNVRDTYFAAIGVTFEKELTALYQRFLAKELTAEEYTKELTKYFNDTSDEAIEKVEPNLMKIKDNIYSFETDTGKADLVNGNINLNYAWSGDAVYAMDLAEEENDCYFNYFVPMSGSNLWFDGWVMPKGVTERGTKQAAQAFVNFLSMPYNAMRNSYFIGYTSVISGEENEMLDYADYLYGYYPEDEFEEGEEYPEPVEYDLSYFFLGENYGEDVKHITIPADPEQASSRQLYAQFPPESVIARCAVMDYYGEEASVRINELWSRVKAETLDAWAIIVICVTVVGIALFTVFVKFGNKIDLGRKPKKGYRFVSREDPTRI